MGSDRTDMRVDLAATYDHAECMCLKDERCRYHEALDRAETLAAENARLRGWLTYAAYNMIYSYVQAKLEQALIDPTVNPQEAATRE